MHLVTLWGLVTPSYTLFLLDPYKDTMVVNLEQSVQSVTVTGSVTSSWNHSARMDR